MVVRRIVKSGSILLMHHWGGTVETAIPSAGGLWYVPRLASDILRVQDAGRELILWYRDGTRDVAYKAPGEIFYATKPEPPPPIVWYHPMGGPRPWTTYNDGGGSHSNGALDFGTQGQALPLYAAHDGQVIRAGWESGGGGNVVIIRPTGGTGEGIVYAHMSQIDVSLNQMVSGGQKVGNVGNTGTATGYHLHLEVRRNGVQWGPWWPAFNYFQTRGVYLGPQA